MCFNEILTYSLILSVTYLLFVYLYAGSNWEVCKAGRHFAPVHRAREV